MAYSLLIVEDNPAIAKIQKFIATKVGYSVDVAETMAEAIELIEVNDYFCAVVDYMLPDANLGEAIALTVGADIPTIVMTGKLDDKTRDLVMQFPVVDYITKESRQAYLYLEKQLTRLPRNEKVTVLVVDDSSPARKYISNLLYRHKFNILQVADAFEALEILESNKNITVIITDNEMPNMTGVQLTAKIRERYNSEEKVIIGISGTEDIRLSAAFLKNGANDYLRKPFYPEEFYYRLSQNLDMLEHIEIIRKQANSDHLTGLPNRRYFFEQAQQQISKQHDDAKICAMLDIDFFKKINDSYGHDGGDLVLKHFAKLLGNHFAKDLCARFGGEEFAILFKSQSLSSCAGELEKFRQAVEHTKLAFEDAHITFTVSIGLVKMKSDNIDLILKNADELLYQAKESGRNRLIFK